MVHLFPNTEQEVRLKNANVSESELKIYKAFQHFDDDWWVWHSVYWRNPNKDETREADFVILHKYKGFIVLEIKGGDISLEKGEFYSYSSRNRKRKQKSKQNINQSENFTRKYRIKNPFKQAIEAMHRLKDFYVEQARIKENSSDLLLYNNEGKAEFPGAYSYGVIFPDSYFKKKMESEIYLEFDQNQIFDKTDLKEELEWELKKNTIYSTLQSFLLGLLENRQGKRRLDEKIVEFFNEIMSPTISVQLFYKEYLDDCAELMETINEKQDYLIDSLIVKKDLAIEGSAGSGKTFLAVKKAMRLLQQRKKVLILCYNRKLRGFINELIEKFEKSMDILNENENLEDFVLCLNIFEFAERVADDLADDPQKNELKEYIRTYKKDKTAVMINSIIERHGIPENHLFDGILIDEAQDMGKHFYPLFRKFLKKPYETFYIFFDIAQALFEEGFDLKEFGLDEKRDLIKLPQNLRNSVEIANYIQQNLSIGEYRSLSGVHALEVKTKKVNSITAAFQELIDEIAVNFYNTGFPTNKIIILGIHRLQTYLKDCFNNDYDASQKADFVDVGLKKRFLIIFPKHPETFEMVVDKNPGFDYYIEFSTIRSFKGLERDIVFLLLDPTELEKGDKRDNAENLKMQTYVGMSRAKFILNIIEYTT